MIGDGTGIDSEIALAAIIFGTLGLFVCAIIRVVQAVRRRRAAVADERARRAIVTAMGQAHELLVSRGITAPSQMAGLYAEDDEDGPLAYVVVVWGPQPMLQYGEVPIHLLRTFRAGEAAAVARGGVWVPWSSTPDFVQQFTPFRPDEETP